MPPKVKITVNDEEIDLFEALQLKDSDKLDIGIADKAVTLEVKYVASKGKLVFQRSTSNYPRE